jgi:hypothetical protein
VEGKQIEAEARTTGVTNFSFRYRRGKTQCGDVDIVFCPPEEGQDIGLLKDLYLRLSDLNIITHVLRECKDVDLNLRSG